MKKFIIATLLTISMTNTIKAEEIPNLNMDKCIEISEFATKVMTGRQNGEPMTKYLNIDNPPYAKYRSMVITAYNMQRFNTEEYKQRSVEEFSNMGMVACVEAMERRGIEY